MILVVPTNRESSIKKFLKAWRGREPWTRIIVVEDNPTKTFDVDVDHHYSWNDIDWDLRENAWIISRRDSAIRSYGFLKASQMGDALIGTLDDDCFPEQDQPFVAGHEKNLYDTPQWCESVPGLRTRGLPYKNLGRLTTTKFSVGLWTGVPDLDSVHMLTDHNQEFMLPKTRVMPAQQFFPWCGMNFAFRREAAPLCYFPPMGVDSPFGRFDDIWFGIICKYICDHLGWCVTVGEPYVRHSKESCPFKNLVKEAPGIEFNESFWKYILQIPLSADTPQGCMREIGMWLQEHTPECDHSTYLKKLGRAMEVWSQCSF